MALIKARRSPPRRFVAAHIVGPPPVSVVTKRARADLSISPSSDSSRLVSRNSPTVATQLDSAQRRRENARDCRRSQSSHRRRPPPSDRLSPLVPSSAQNQRRWRSAFINAHLFGGALELLSGHNSSSTWAIEQLTSLVDASSPSRCRRVGLESKF